MFDERAGPVGGVTSDFRLLPAGATGVNEREPPGLLVDPRPDRHCRRIILALCLVVLGIGTLAHIAEDRLGFGGVGNELGNGMLFAEIATGPEVGPPAGGRQDRLENRPLGVIAAGAALAAFEDQQPSQEAVG